MTRRGHDEKQQLRACRAASRVNCARGNPHPRQELFHPWEEMVAMMKVLDGLGYHTPGNSVMQIGTGSPA